jgi:hypothetical protein
MFNELAAQGMPPARKGVKIDASRLSPMFVRVLANADKLQATPMQYDKLPDASVQTPYFSGIDELFAGVITGDQFVEKVQAAIDALK